jgi:hypothetical protein
VARTPLAEPLADCTPELFTAVDCDSLVVKCPTCSGGIYGDQLEDHDQWSPRSSIGMAAC